MAGNDPPPARRTRPRLRGRACVAAHDIPAGASLTEKTIAIKRPGTGLPPAMRPLLVGKTAGRDIRAGTLLTLEMVT